MRFFKSLLFLLSFSVLFIIPAGCGSGGGGINGVNVDDPSSMSYTGLTSMASIDTGNAVDVSTGSYNGLSSGSVASTMGSQYVVSGGQIDRSLILHITRTTKEAVLKADISSGSYPSAIGAIVTESDVLKGDCGGNAPFTIHINDETGDFTAKFDFNKYCNEGSTLTGTINYSGKIILVTGRMTQFRASFENIESLSECGSFTMSGNMTSDLSLLSHSTETMNGLMRDNATGRVFKLENYVVHTTKEVGYEVDEISGNYYDPGHGYVTVSTDVPLRTHVNGEHPVQGVLIISGNTGIAGESTKARLTFISDSVYAIEADTDGDGVYDWSRIMNWGEGCSESTAQYDTEAPAVPGGLTVNLLSDSEIGLSWGKPNDNVRVTGYKIFRDGVFLKSVTDTSYSDTGLEPNTEYCYTVSALDAGGNESVQSSEVCELSGKIELFSDSGQRIGQAKDGMALGDLDGDGDLDAFITCTHGYEEVWFNDGNGWFSDSGQDFGSYYKDIVLGDIDGDGDLDAFITSFLIYSDIWINDGVGNFSYSGQRLDGTHGAALGDLDGDGDLDAFVVYYGTGAPNKVWLNDGHGNFSDSGQNMGDSRSSNAALGDLDGDGDLDAFVVNNLSEPDRVWLNDGSGYFSDSGQSLGSSYSNSVALGDLDGDGDLDAFVANDHGEQNIVWLNEGSGYFLDSGQNLGISFSNSVALDDLDGDGDLDVYVANDMYPNNIWINDGYGHFLDIIKSQGYYYSDIALGDLDGDGDKDIFLVNGKYKSANQVWLNNTIQ